MLHPNVGREAQKTIGLNPSEHAYLIKSILHNALWVKASAECTNVNVKYYLELKAFSVRLIRLISEQQTSL